MTTTGPLIESQTPKEGLQSLTPVVNRVGDTLPSSLPWVSADRSGVNLLQPTATLHHLLQRKLLSRWLERHGLEPRVSLPLLRHLAAAPSGLPVDPIDPASIADLAAAHLVRLGPPDPAPRARPFVFVRALNFELTHGCNLACSHCLQEAIRPTGAWPWLDAAAALRTLADAAALGLTQTGVNFTGGEVFSRGSPLLALLDATRTLAIPTRVNTNAWWGLQSSIPLGERIFADDREILAALRRRGLGRLALSLDDRYEQYPHLLERLVRVACLCEEAGQDYEVVATEPRPEIARTATRHLHQALGRKPRHLHLTPMEMVDIGGAAPSGRRALDPANLPALVRAAPCATAGFHRPYYLHVGPDGGLRSCLYAPAAGWLGNVVQQPLAALLNSAAANPIAALFASGDFEAFLARAVTPWRHLYSDPHHGCAASALLARIAEEVHRLETAAGRSGTPAELENLHRRIAAEYRLVPPGPAAARHA